LPTQIGFGEVARVGCCAVAALVTPTHVVVANAGDCRAVYGRVMHAPPAAVNIDAGALPGSQRAGAGNAGSSKGFVSAQSAHAFSSGGLGGEGGRDADLPPFLRQGALPPNVSYSSPSASMDGDDTSGSSGNNNAPAPSLLHSSTSSSPRERAEVEAAAAIEREEGRRMEQRLRWAAQSARGGSDDAGADTGPLARLIAVISGLTRGNGVVGPPAGLGGGAQRRADGGDFGSLPPSPADLAAQHSADAAVAFSPFGLGSPLGGGSFSPLQVEAVPLSDDHNARIPREQAALRLMHPGEDDVVVSGGGSRGETDVLQAACCLRLLAPPAHALVPRR
jgi:hypothetical protein